MLSGTMLGILWNEEDDVKRDKAGGKGPLSIPFIELDP
jgi:hypothetical protein